MNRADIDYYEIYRIYISHIPERDITDGELEKLYPGQRRQEIAEAKQARVRREKYFVWRLLEMAISDCFGNGIDDYEFKKNDTGRWVAEGFDFSLSHSEGVCAVLLHRRRGGESCGVDIQKIDAPHTDAFAKRILNEREYKEYSLKPEAAREDYLICRWCAKEAVFKASRKSAFSPAKIDTDSGVYTEIIELPQGRYAIAATKLQDTRGEAPEIVRIKMY